MIELLFLACFSQNVAQCEEHSFQYVDMTPMSCMMGAQPVLAKWGDQHPNWIITKWKCQYLSQREVRA